MTVRQRLASTRALWRIPENLGDWVVSWRFWLLLALIRLPILDQRLLANHNNYYEHQLPSLLVAYVASGVPVFLASVTVLRARRRTRPSVAVSIIVWLISDLVLSTTAIAFLGKSNLRSARVAEPLNILIHAIGTIPIGATIVFSLCLLALSRQKVSALGASLARQREIVSNLDSYLSAIRLRFSRQVRATLVPGFERIKTDAAAVAEANRAEGDLMLFAARVRQYSIDQVRSLSHEIAESDIAAIPAPTPSLNSIYDAGRYDASVIAPPNATLVAWLYLAFGIIVNPETSMWFIAFQALLLFAGQHLMTRAAKKLAGMNRAANFGWVALSLVVPAVVLATVASLMQARSSIASTFILASVIAIAAFAVNYPYRFYRAVGLKLEVAEQQASEAQSLLKAEAAAIRDSFSRIIHGKIQGRLALVSFVLGQLESSKNCDENHDLQLNRLLALIDSIEAEMLTLAEPAPRQTLVATIEALRQEWAGLLQIETVIDQEQLLTTTPELENELSLIVEEAVLNARVHGQASKVSIRLQQAANRPAALHLTVRDNGLGLVGEVSAGLGSQHYAAVCQEWSLTSADAGTTLEAFISLEPAAI